MGFGVSIKLAPGVRVRASTRGVRASVGPRAARVHVGSGRTRVSSGVGPFTVSSGVGTRRASPRRASASGSRSGGGQRVTLAQLERQARTAERAQQIADIASLERQLTGLHREDFAPAQREVLPPQPSPPRRRGDATPGADPNRAGGHQPFHGAERRNAKAAAAAAATDLARRQHVAALIEAQRAQVDLDQAWDGLRRHDPTPSSRRSMRPSPTTRASPPASTPATTTSPGAGTSPAWSSSAPPTWSRTSGRPYTRRKAHPAQADQDRPQRPVHPSPGLHRPCHSQGSPRRRRRRRPGAHPRRPPSPSTILPCPDA